MHLSKLRWERMRRGERERERVDRLEERILCMSVSRSVELLLKVEKCAGYQSTHFFVVAFVFVFFHVKGRPTGEEWGREE